MLDRLFGGGKPRILVADDDDSVASLVTDVLEGQGYSVTRVCDGQEAVHSFRKGKFDLVILDVHMPKMEGPQALEAIRLLPGGREVDVLMLTSEGNMGTLIRTSELGIVAYLPKPVPVAKLVEQVNACLAKKNPPKA